MEKRKFGTREWAKVNLNIQKGCHHGCRYCYACYNAIKRYKWFNSRDEWMKNIRLRYDKVTARPRKVDGRIMYPTQHDICPEFIEEHIKFLRRWLLAKNDILLVMKPHFYSVYRICRDLKEFRNHITFRFTISSSDDRILSFWEPGAPKFKERLDALRYARHNAHFTTSVSMEPQLDTAERTVILASSFLKDVDDSIWIGKMNFAESRIRALNERDMNLNWGEKEWRLYSLIFSEQTDEKVEWIHSQLDGFPKIRWKDSIKKVLGLSDEEVG